MDNIGRVIKDFYCNGFFGREYDFEGSIIVGEGPEWIVIRKTNGLITFADFQSWDYERDETGYPISIKNLTVRDKQEYIDKWCEDNSEY